MAKEKALFGEWATLKPADVNRILKPHGVRLVVKGSKAWGAKVNVTAQAIAKPVVGLESLPGAPAAAGGADG